VVGRINSQTARQQAEEAKPVGKVQPVQQIEREVRISLVLILPQIVEVL
jgi:hypothetical protein